MMNCKKNYKEIQESGESKGLFIEGLCLIVLGQIFKSESEVVMCKGQVWKKEMGKEEEIFLQ